MFLRKGDVPGSRSMDVFPVRVGSRSPNYSTDNEAAKFTVSFSITEKLMQDAAVIHELGWVPLGGYCGSDVLWHVHCLVCDHWSGPRFYSHVRRNRPAFRHPGCIAESEHPAALAKLALRARTTCPCQITHPTTEDDVAATLAAIAKAQIQQDTDRMLAQIDRFLGTCPANGPEGCPTDPENPLGGQTGDTRARTVAEKQGLTTIAAASRV